MSTEERELRLVRLRLDARKMIELGRRRGLPVRDVDTGYLVHCMIGELFGDLAPRPFAVARTDRRAVEVLGYSESAADALRQEADAFADPWLHGAADWDTFAVKTMPARWPVGSRVAFGARVCPVVRMPRGSTSHRPGAELDAFLARCQAEDDNAISREAVYRDWFQARIPHEAASAVSVRMKAFTLGRLVRRTQGQDRSARVRTRPDVRLTGAMEIADSQAFNALLRRGVGRHRSFGFGMLLLRRP